MSDKQPNNLLLVLCDQLSASALRLYGGAVPTPNLSALAAQSVRFTNCYCQSPLCTPSRASLLTGLYPHHHGCVSNVMRIDYPTIGGPETEEGLTNADQTLSKVLSQIGYDTAYFGKWHLSGEWPQEFSQRYQEHYEYAEELRDRFQEVSQLPAEQRMNWYGWLLPVTVSESLQKACRTLPEDFAVSPFTDFLTKMGRLELPEEESFDYRVTSRCIRYLKESRDKPFFLTCSLNMPHDPNVIMQPYYDLFSDPQLQMDLPCEARFRKELSRRFPEQTGEAFMREFLRIYYGAVAFVDAQLGRLLSALEESGKREQTSIVFVSDHGDMAGGHSMFWKSTSAFYEEVARVPLLLSVPGLSPGLFEQPVEMVDLLPTLLAVCGKTAPLPVDGENLLPYLKKEAPVGERCAISERLFWPEGNRRKIHSADAQYGFMLRYGQYKYCVYGQEEPFESLYNLQTDPQEYENLATHPESNAVLQELRERLKQRLAKTGYTLCDTH